MLDRSAHQGLDAPTVRRIGLPAAIGSALLLVLGVPAAEGRVGDATPSVEIRLAADDAWDHRAASEQQPALDVTFFVRVTNRGEDLGTFSVRGDHGGGAFAVRYLGGGAGDERITGEVVEGSFLMEDVPPGATRTLRLRVRVDPSARLDRTGGWTIDVASTLDPSTTDRVNAEVRTVAQAFARAAGVTLRAPAASASITFHESPFGSAAALRPLGTLLRNANPAFDPPPDRPGPGYVVMDSRGRATPPTSGSDDVVAEREPILAPVSGTVIRVTAYDLYCEWSDVRVAIRPDDAPERTVQVFHLVDPKVRRGDHVLVSRTVLGRARAFPFRSQTQDYGLGGRHVHLEIERDGSAPLPGCGGRALP
jgi:hypothetical protein